MTPKVNDIKRKEIFGRSKTENDLKYVVVYAHAYYIVFLFVKL